MGVKAVPQSVTLTVVGALSFSRWREDKQLVFWVCCAGADNAGCQQSLIFPTVANPSWGRFNRYIATITACCFILPGVFCSPYFYWESSDVILEFPV